ncbi:MAG: efflux RND transporter periplasmic adaptor subunit [Leptolyngbyaceae cyanobacterium bins.302]|nr:efflux RND transporter periplasmic adaptor subunit [Leptolyngbyaceae cyanobacterium bins.302]
MQLPLISKVTKKPNPWLIGLLAAGAIGLPATAFVATRTNAPKADIKEYVVPVSQKEVTVRITANGEVIPVRRLNLNPKTAGRLAELYVEQGDRVQQGQIVARMDSRELQAQRQQALAELARVEANLNLVRAGNRPEAIGQAQANVNQAQAEVAAAQTRLDLASQRTQRNQALASDGAISRDRLDEVLNEQRSAQANVEQASARYNNAVQQLRQQRNGARSQEVDQAAAQVEAARANLQAIETQLEDTEIRAPFAGVITQKNATEGDFVTPTSFSSSTSSATSIVTLANDLEILAKVPEVDIGQIKPGQQVEIKVDSYPNQIFKGEVRLVSPEAKEDPTQRGVITFEVRVKMLTGKDKLRSGMTADLAFLGQRVDNALMVPTVAIITNKGQTGVLVPDRNNKPKFQPVTIGPNIGNETKILDGVKPGDPVFVELPEGQKLDDIIKGMEKQ